MVFLIPNEDDGEQRIATTAQAAREVWAATLRDPRNPKNRHVALVTFADGGAWVWIGGDREPAA